MPWSLEQGTCPSGHCCMASHCGRLEQSLLSLKQSLLALLQEALALAGSKDWTAACRGLLLIRRLVQHNRELCEPQL